MVAYTTWANGSGGNPAWPAGGTTQKLTGGGTNLPTSEVSGPTTLTPADAGAVLCETTGGAFTVTLPPVGGNDELVYDIKNIGTETLTVDGDGAETIDSGLTAVLTVQYEAITIVCDGTEWWIL